MDSQIGTTSWLDDSALRTNVPYLFVLNDEMNLRKKMLLQLDFPILLFSENLLLITNISVHIALPDKVIKYKKTYFQGHCNSMSNKHELTVNPAGVESVPRP